MKIIVANKDRSGDLGAGIQAAVGRRLKDSGLSPEAVLSSLSHSRNPEEFQKYVRRYGQIAGISAAGSMAPPGWLARFRLRMQHALDRLGFDWKHAPMKPGRMDVLRLGETDSEAAFQERFIQYVRIREGVDTNPFRIPRAPGLRGSLAVRLKVFLWRLLRYQHDRIAFRQNLINANLGGALELEHHLRSREADELRRRLAGLEKRLETLESARAAGPGAAPAFACGAGDAKPAGNG